MRSLIFFSLLLVTALPFAAQGQQKSYRPELGKPHFDFTLPRIDNRKPFSLSDYRGNKVLLLHFASW